MKCAPKFEMIFSSASSNWRLKGWDSRICDR